MKVQFSEVDPRQKAQMVSIWIVSCSKRFGLGDLTGGIWPGSSSTGSTYQTKDYLAQTSIRSS